MSDKSTDLFLERIATALERIAPPEKKINNLNQGEGFVFDSKTGLLRPVEEINRIPLSLLQGIKHQKEILLKNRALSGLSEPVHEDRQAGGCW